MHDLEEPIRTVLDFLVEKTSKDKLPLTDGIFVFGHINKVLPACAADLYLEGKAKKIVLTGKGRIEIPDGFSTEAELYASIVEAKGVPLEDIILEKESTNSLENVLFGMKKCHENGFYPKSLILVSMPPLLKRALATFKKQFPELELYGSTFDLPISEYLEPTRTSNIRNPIRLVGELERFREYADKGDMITVEIPENVKSAADVIKNASHTL